MNVENRKMRYCEESNFWPFLNDDTEKWKNDPN